MNITLLQHCSPVGTVPNKYAAKITVKMRKSKMLDFFNENLTLNQLFLRYNMLSNNNSAITSELII